jgi:hypothetical protein
VPWYSAAEKRSLSSSQNWKKRNKWCIWIVFWMFDAAVDNAWLLARSKKHQWTTCYSKEGSFNCNGSIRTMLHHQDQCSLASWFQAICHLLVVNQPCQQWAVCTLLCAGTKLWRDFASCMQSTITWWMLCWILFKLGSMSVKYKPVLWTCVFQKDTFLKKIIYFILL